VSIETVTVMFTDLVDSTALSSRLGEKRGEEVRREHFGLLRGVVEPSGGREVKNLGDGLMVAFSSTSDAVSAAVGMQQAFARRNRRVNGDPLLVRIGISCGDADVEEGDYFGVPVVEAARLCGTAGGGEVLATELVRLVAGSRSGHTFTSLGGLELKGLEDPVAAHRIEWAAADAGPASPSLPARLAAAQAAVFVGREREYERLDAAWKAVDGGAAGGVGIMLVSGEPGIGKTTLSARFAADVHGKGAVVVYGRCDEDLGIPYKPWVEALAQLVAWLPDEVLAAHVAERGGSIARLIPGLAPRLGSGLPEPGDGDAQRFVLFACVADLLARAADERAVLVVLDDLHWADQATVQLLCHLATAGAPTRVGVLGTFRDSDVGSSHPLADALAALHRDGRVERISLRGFDDGELLALLEGIAGHEMTADGVALRDAVLAETSGNPFFAVEVLRHLAETGAIYQGADGRWASTVDLQAAGLPISVKEVVGHRLARLGAETERVLSLAAVIGRDFDVPLLARVADVDDDALIELCDAAVSAAVLATTDDPDGYTFAHALIAHTLHDGLSPARRARAHRAVAEQLEALVGDDPGDRVGELARHWMAATAPAEVVKAVRYAAAAGARALEQLAPDEALRWYGEAHALVERHGSDDRERVDILLGLGTAQHHCGVGAHRETLLDTAWLADRIDAVDLLAQAALTNSRGFASAIGHVDEARLEVIGRALERLGDTDLALRAELLGLAAAERFYADDLPTRLSLADEAVRTSRRSGDPQALFRTLKLALEAIGGPSTLAQQIEWSDEMSRLAEESGDPADRSAAANMSAQFALVDGNLAAFRSGSATIDELIDRVPSATLRWTYGWREGLSVILAGELGAAERLAGEIVTLGEQIGQTDVASFFGAYLANIRYHQGRLHELTPQIEQAIVDSPGLPAYRAVLADACARGGDLRRATALLDADRAGGLTMREDKQWTTAHAAWTVAAVLVGDTATAELLHDRLQPHHDQMVITVPTTVHCAVAHYLGMLDHLLGRHDDAERRFEEAMAIHDGMESPLLVAYTDAAWSALLADRDRGDDRQRARAMAERAVTVATAGGYGDIQSDARNVLARIS